MTDTSKAGDPRKRRELQSSLERLGIVPLAYWGQRILEPCFALLKKPRWRIFTRDDVLDCEKVIAELIRNGPEGLEKRLDEAEFVSYHLNALRPGLREAGGAIRSLIATLRNLVRYYEEGRHRKVHAGFLRRPLQDIGAQVSVALRLDPDRWVEHALAVSEAVFSTCGHRDYLEGFSEELLKNLAASLSGVPPLLE